VVFCLTLSSNPYRLMQSAAIPARFLPVCLSFTLNWTMLPKQVVGGTGLVPGKLQNASMDPTMTEPDGHNPEVTC